jgi:hypothetical protein
MAMHSFEPAADVCVIMRACCAMAVGRLELEASENGRRSHRPGLYNCQGQRTAH